MKKSQLGPNSLVNIRRTISSSITVNMAEASMGMLTPPTTTPSSTIIILLLPRSTIQIGNPFFLLLLSGSVPAVSRSSPEHLRHMLCCTQLTESNPSVFYERRKHRGHLIILVMQANNIANGSSMIHIWGLHIFLIQSAKFQFFGQRFHLQVVGMVLQMCFIHFHLLSIGVADVVVLASMQWRRTNTQNEDGGRNPW